MGTVNDVGSIARSSVVCLEGNGQRPSHRGDGFRAGGVSYTLNAVDVHCVAYGISPYHSNAMLSSNPHSGIYVADTSRSLDAMNCGYPGCNQGGIAIVEIRSPRTSSK